MANTTTNMGDFPVYGIGLVFAVNLIGIVGNSLLIIAHVKDPLKHFKFPSSLFIFTTAVADLLISCSFIFLCISYLFHTVNEEVNEIPNILLTVFHSVSFLMYLSLAIERFCSVTFPFWHRVNITTRRCRYWVVEVWFVCTIFGLVHYVIRMRVPEFKFQSEMAQAVFMWTMFLITQCVYIACFISIRKRNIDVMQSNDRINDATTTTIKLRLKNENNFLLTIAIVCFILALTTLPFATMVFTFAFKAMANEGKRLSSYHIWTLLAISINSAINVFVYLWRLPKYRKTFKKLFCDCYRV